MNTMKRYESFNYDVIGLYKAAAQAASIGPIEGAYAATPSVINFHDAAYGKIMRRFAEVVRGAVVRVVTQPPHFEEKRDPHPGYQPNPDRIKVGQYLPTTVGWQEVDGLRSTRQCSSVIGPVNMDLSDPAAGVLAVDIDSRQAGRLFGAIQPVDPVLPMRHIAVVRPIEECTAASSDMSYHQLVHIQKIGWASKGDLQ